MPRHLVGIELVTFGWTLVLLSSRSNVLALGLPGREDVLSCFGVLDHEDEGTTIIRN